MYIQMLNRHKAISNRFPPIRVIFWSFNILFSRLLTSYSVFGASVQFWHRTDKLVCGILCPFLYVYAACVSLVLFHMKKRSDNKIITKIIVEFFCQFWLAYDRTEIFCRFWMFMSCECVSAVHLINLFQRRREITDSDTNIHLWQNIGLLTWIWRKKKYLNWERIFWERD